MYRYHASKRKTEPPTRKGRPRSVTLHKESGYQKQIQELEMEPSYSVLFFTMLEDTSKFSIVAMCKIFGISRNGYYAYLKSTKEDRDQELAMMIRQCQKETDHTYGYRRVCLWMDRKGTHVNHKRVFRVMNRYGLFSEIRRLRKHQQMTEQLHRYPNLLNREFRAKRLNEKWVTDISYIPTPQGTLYLSMIRDLYDNSIIAYKMETQQSIHLVEKTIRAAAEKKRSLQSCNFTVIKGFSTPHKPISP